MWNLNNRQLPSSARMMDVLQVRVAVDLCEDRKQASQRVAQQIGRRALAVRLADKCVN